MQLRLSNLILLLGFLTTSVAQATISDLNVVGASEFDDESTTPIIYGGLAGSTGVSTSDFSFCEDTSVENTTNGCNNCGASRIPCNESRIFDNRYITITFKSTVDGYALVKAVDENVQIPNVNSISNLSAGSVHTYTMRWGDVCSSLDDSISSCEIGSDELISKNISVGVSTDNDTSFDDSATVAIRVYSPVSTDTLSDDCSSADERGVCSFVVNDGDEKVFLSDINVATAFPTVISDITIEKVRIMASTTSFDDTGPDLIATDIDVVNTEEIGDDVVDGLDNDTIYAFSFASIDEAGNVAYFLSDSLFDSACSGVGVTTTTNISGLSDAAVAGCPYLGQPGSVVGLLKDDLNCFVATAAYGTHMHEHLNILRKFRNKFLLTTKWGKKFVRYYYSWGAKFSFWVRDSVFFKYASLAVIWPAIGFAHISLTYGIGFALALIGLGVFLIALVANYLRDKSDGEAV